MRNIQPGTRLGIYLMSVVFIVLLQKIALILILCIGLLSSQVWMKNLSLVWRNFRYSSPFLIAFIIYGFLPGSGGTIFGFSLVLKLSCIVLLNSWIFRTFSENDLLIGLSQLKFPELITTIIFFIFRYRGLFFKELAQLQQARKLRGGRTGRKGFHFGEYSLLGEIIGAGLVRSLDRGDRVYQAMRLRGIKAGVLIKNQGSFMESSLVLIIIAVVIFLLILLDRQMLRLL